MRDAACGSGGELRDTPEEALPPAGEEPCPKCGKGVVCEWMVGWFCSRRYEKGGGCDWESGG